LHSGSAGRINDPSINAFIAVLDSKGYTVNQNLTLDPNTPLWSNDNPTSVANNAKKLATNSKLDLIIAAGGPASVYALLKAQDTAKTNTNVVFTSFSQLTSPASNMTGVDARTSELDGTRLRMLYDLVQKDPKWATQKTFGVLENDTREDYDPSILDGVAAALKINKPNRVSVTPGPNKQAIRDLIKKAFEDGPHLFPCYVCWWMLRGSMLRRRTRSTIENVVSGLSSAKLTYLALRP
jgi:PIN domain nuclease of toxin-antitoxin system